MSYNTSAEKKHLQPPPSTGLKGKAGFKPKGSFDKEMVDKASDAALKDTKGSE